MFRKALNIAAAGVMLSGVAPAVNAANDMGLDWAVPASLETFAQKSQEIVGQFAANAGITMPDGGDLTTLRPFGNLEFSQ